MKYKFSKRAHKNQVAQKKQQRAAKLARRSKSSVAVVVKPAKSKKPLKVAPTPKVKVQKPAKVVEFATHPDLSFLPPEQASTMTFVCRFRKRKVARSALVATDHLRVPAREGRAYYRVRPFPREGVVALQWIRKRGEMFELRTGRMEHGVYPSSLVPFADKQRAINAIRELI